MGGCSKRECGSETESYGDPLGTSSMFCQNAKIPYARARLRAEMLGTYTRENSLKPTIQAHVMQERAFKSKYEDAPHDKDHDFELHTR